MTNSLITVSAVVFSDRAGRILTVRKRGTGRFMMVGGKPEGDETPRATAIREAHEETGIALGWDDLTLLGRWRESAANEAGHSVRSTVFCARQPLEDVPEVMNEIADARWLDPAGSLPGDLAPLLEHCILPGLADRDRAARAGEGSAPAWDLDDLAQAVFGDTPAMHDRLAALVADGRKQATSSLLADYEAAGEAPPADGALAYLTDSRGALLGLVETLRCRVVPLGEVDDDFARREGEGFADAAQWRRAHEQFWGRGHLGDDTPVVTEEIGFTPHRTAPAQGRLPRPHTGARAV